MADNQVAINGQTYQDETQAVALTHPNIPPDLKRVYITKNPEPPADIGEETGRNVAGSDSGSQMPLGSTEKPAGALESPEATQVAPETQATPEPSESPEPVADTTQSTAGLGNLSIINTVKGMMNPSFDEDKQIINDFYETAKNALSLPHDVYKGDVPSGSIQEVERASDLARLMTTGPAPVAAKMADGSLGSFMGVRAGTFDKNALVKAQGMEAVGTHPDEIWDATKTFRGADGRWRQEIPDQNLNILAAGTNLHPAAPMSRGIESWTRVDAPETISVKDSRVPLPPDASIGDIFKYLKQPEKDYRLGHVLDHPELYDAYPWLKNTKIRPMPEDLARNLGYRGMVSDRTIYMDRLPTEEFTGTLMHEIQHVIQTHEGFAQGANLKMFLPPELQAAERHLPRLEQEFMDDKKLDTASLNHYKGIVQYSKTTPLDKMSPGVRETIEKALEEMQNKGLYQGVKNLVDSEHLLDKAKTEAHDKYLAVMGEVEARHVQARLNMSQFARDMNSPTQTEEKIMPRSQQIAPDAISANMVGASEKPIQMRRAANDNTPSDMEDFKGLSEDLFPTQKAVDTWDGFTKRSKRGLEIIDERAKILKNLDKRALSEIEEARLEKLMKEHNKLFPK